MPRRFVARSWQRDAAVILAGQITEFTRHISGF
jgi:hypothetical protein